MKNLLCGLLLSLLLITARLDAQNVAINTTGAAAVASAILDITSTSAGLLIPRMTAAQRAAIGAPATGLIVYQTDAGTMGAGFYFYNGAVWTPWSTNSGGWGLAGNAGTAIATNFIGTTDNVAFAVRSNNVERFRFNTNGEVIAGNTASPYVGDLVVGYGTATNTFGINGYTALDGSGTWGEVLVGSATNYSAVQGVYGGSGVGSGAFGNYAGTNASALRAGVAGVLTAPAAAGAGVGVYGANQITSGNQRMGVYGTYNGLAYGLAVVGIGFGGGIPAGNNDIAVVGWRANNQNYSGYFNGNHVIANGTKSASVGTSKGNQLLYCTETPEVWFEDIGSGQLVNGEVTITLDPIYIETIVVDEKHPMHVFIQMEGESNEVYVIPGTTSFTVKERDHGTSNAKFSYRIMAKRLNFQDHRFGNDPLWGPGDTRQYSQYATPPPVDYNENVKFQEEQKKNYKPTPMPQGFLDYFQLQKAGAQFELIKHK